MASGLGHTAWQRRSRRIGTKGFRVYDWALIESDDPGCRYMIRRNIDDATKLAHYRCHNPDHVGFSTLVHAAGARWPIDECFGASKNEVGLDNYQVRTWIAWHRHITFSMLSHTFLAVIARKERPKKGASAGDSDKPKARYS